MHKSLESLSKAELLHLLFYMKISKRYKVTFPLQYCLDNYINEFSIKEIGLMAMTFKRFEVKLQIKSSYSCVVRKLIEAKSDVDDLFLPKIFDVSIFFKVSTC